MRKARAAPQQVEKVSIAIRRENVLCEEKCHYGTVRGGDVRGVEGKGSIKSDVNL